MTKKAPTKKKSLMDRTQTIFRIVGSTLVVLGLAWQQIEATRLGYQVETARRQAQLLRGRLGALEKTLETSLSPAELAAQAKAMGMVESGPESLRVLGAPAPAPRPDGLLRRLLAGSWRSPLST